MSRGQNGQWLPGASGNPGGKKWGERDRLSKRVIALFLAEVEAEDSKVSLQELKKKKPHIFWQVAMALCPKQIQHMDITEEMSDDEIRDLIADIRAAKTGRDGSTLDGSASAEDDAGPSRH
jgi:hypothetical protein